MANRRIIRRTGLEHLDRDLRVLLVEDDERQAKPFKLYLESSSRRCDRGHGFRVTIAPDPESARIAAAERHYDAHIVDGHLQNERDGFELCAALRALCPDAPNILLTGHYTTPADSQSAADYPIDAFLLKPCTDQIAATIRHQVTRLRALRRTRERGPLIVTPDCKHIWVWEAPVTATAGERDVLIALIDAACAVTHETLRGVIAESDGRQNQKSTQLHTFMSRLRDTLRRGDPGGRETEASDWLQSVPGIGYQIADPEVARAQGLQLHSERAAKRDVQSARPRHSGMMLRAGTGDDGVSTGTDDRD